MPSLEDNRATWGDDYGWEEQGDEWSRVWGGVDSHWSATLLPRIREFVPTGTILEIAPGYGRWTRYLIGLCEQYYGVDIAPACIDYCESTFKSAAHATFAVNDGRSLSLVADRSVDLGFSFDSLVHVEADVLESYVNEFSSKLADDGVAFLHHSNLGAYLSRLRLSRRLQAVVHEGSLPRRALRRYGLTDWDHWRATSVTAERFDGICASAGLVCVGQETINWGRTGRRLIDCISLVARPGSRWDRPNVVSMNRFFMAEARSARLASAAYSFRDEPRLGGP
jgi:SAM-dependent methyltransferase